MAWATGKAAIVAALKTVAITSPSSITTTVVYETPPGALTTEISWVLFPPRIRVERHPGGWRTNHYRYRARLFVYDQDSDVASLIVENLVESAIAVFDSQTSLRVGGVQTINGPDVDEPGTLQMGSRLWHIADCFFEVELGEAKTFS